VKEDRFTRALKDLVKAIRSADPNARNIAARDAAMLLEMNVSPVNVLDGRLSGGYDDRFYEEVVSAPSRQRPLRPEEEENLVRVLHEAITSLPQHDSKEWRNTSLLWALGKSHPWLGCPPLLDILLGQGTTLNESEIHEAVHSLENCLDLPHDDPHFEELAHALRENDPRPLLQTLATASPSHENACLVPDARRLLRELAAFFDPA
jgi:hypothetical protein